MNQLLPDQPPNWFVRLQPAFDRALDAYHGLSGEQRIWLWIGICLAVALLCAGIVFLLVKLVQALNLCLRSDSGWKPIRFLSCMWAGTGVYLILSSFQMRGEGGLGWSVQFAVGLILSGFFAWFLFRRLNPFRAVGALAANSAFGVILAPIVISLGMIAAILVIAVAAWIARRTQMVYVINR